MTALSLKADEDGHRPPHMCPGGAHARPSSNEQSPAAMRFVQCVRPEHPSGGLSVASRAEMLGLLPGSVYLATKETPGVKAAHHGPSGGFLLTEN